MAGTLKSAKIPPGRGHIELWDQAISVPPIQYLLLAAAFTPDGRLRAICSVEFAPVLHDSHFLGMFVDGLHVSIQELTKPPDMKSFEQLAEQYLLPVLLSAR